MSWNKSGNYSQDDLMTMQKDAMERVRQMQRRADEKLRRSNSSPPQQMRQSAPPQKNPPAPENRPHQNPSRPPDPPRQSPNPANFPVSLPHSLATIQPGKITAALSALGVDHDRVILLAVLLILYNDGADVTLLLAILYLLL